jgi:hypothetical protein
MPRPAIESEVIEVIHREQTRRATTEIRVIQYTINGRKYRNLVKQDIFADDTGALRPGKVRGFNAKDWALLTTLETINRVAAALGMGAVTSPAQDAAAMSNLQENPVRDSAPAGPEDF